MSATVTAMKTRMPVEPAALEGSISAFFRKRPEVAAVYVFGSVATGAGTPLSDLDIGVLLKESALPQADPAYHASLTADLMHQLRTNQVDVVLLHEVSPLLAHRVIRDGRRLYVADEQAVHGFEFRTIQRYLDTKPLRRSQAEALAERLRAGGFARRP